MAYKTFYAYLFSLRPAEIICKYHGNLASYGHNCHVSNIAAQAFVFHWRKWVMELMRRNTAVYSSFIKKKKKKQISKRFCLDSVRLICL